MKEVNFLRKRDSAAGRIDFVDIAEPSYRADDNAGITFEQVSCLSTSGGLSGSGRQSLKQGSTAHGVSCVGCTCVVPLSTAAASSFHGTIVA